MIESRAQEGRPVAVERQGPVARVLLNRPEVLNALDLPAWEMLGEAFRELDADADLRCILVQGAGERAFGAGSDIAEFDNVRADREQAREYGRRLHASLESVASCRHPVVAVIRGACVGGGLEIACCCDIRLAAESARFGIPINRLGLTMAYEELRQLLTVASRTVALEILLEGNVFGAERARQLGLVNRVVPDDRLDAEASATAERICAGAPLVNRWHKKFIRRLHDPAPLSPEERDEPYAAFDTEDYRIGKRAFADKTKPEFEGR